METPGDSVTDEALAQFIKAPVMGLKPHPMMGWMAVKPIPGLEIDALEDVTSDTFQQQLGQLGEIIVQKMNEEKPKMIGCKVIEIGATPGLELPFAADDTIFTRSDYGTDLGEYRFMLVDKVMCYKKADED